jgi:hypothetical protein
MNNKKNPNKKNWDEAKMAIATLSVTAVLAFWNLFSRIENSKAIAQAAAVATEPPTQPVPTLVVPTEIPLPTPTSTVIYFTTDTNGLAQTSVNSPPPTAQTSASTVVKETTGKVSKASQPQKSAPDPKPAKTSSSK